MTWPTPGLQGWISLSDWSTQGLPLPWAKVLMARFLSWMPKQVLLQ
jgi:hypothetical protein